MSLEQDVAAARGAIDALERACATVTGHFRDTVDARRLRVDIARLREDLTLLCGARPVRSHDPYRAAVSEAAFYDDGRTSTLTRRWTRRAAGPGDGHRTTPDRGRHPGPRHGWTRPRRAAIAARTLRTDRWWLQPLITVVVLLAFIVYSTFRAFQNAYYFAEPYISPFYSPCITTGCEGDTFPELFTGPAWISPAIYILVIPLGLPADLLLLPEGLLPVVLAVAAGLRRRRAAPALHR